MIAILYHLGVDFCYFAAKSKVCMYLAMVQLPVWAHKLFVLLLPLASAVSGIPSLCPCPCPSHPCPHTCCCCPCCYLFSPESQTTTGPNITCADFRVVPTLVPQFAYAGEVTSCALALPNLLLWWLYPCPHSQAACSLTLYCSSLCVSPALSLYHS